MKYQNFMAPFCGWVSTVSRLEPLRRGILLFTTKFPEIPGTHIIDLGKMKGWVDLRVTQWFWTWYPWTFRRRPWSSSVRPVYVLCLGVSRASFLDLQNILFETFQSFLNILTVVIWSYCVAALKVARRKIKHSQRQ